MFEEVAVEIAEHLQPTAHNHPATCSPVAILLATYNGDRFLEEQINSIIRQSFSDWLIVISDDGSSDGTIALVQKFQQQLGDNRLRLVNGPKAGFVANFMSLINNANIQAQFFAFCDQDDIWHPNHLERALATLKAFADVPALYCSRTRLVFSDGSPFSISPLFSKTPSFNNALVQSLAGGNTMVFNEHARRLMAQTHNLPVVSHDWWAYILISGAGGIVRFSDQPSVDYRQHGGNLIGANSTLKDRLHRIKRMLAGHFQQWNDINLKSLEQCQHLLTEENRQVLRTFTKARQGTLLQRFIRVKRSGVHRQTILGNLGLWLATLLNKL